MSAVLKLVCNHMNAAPLSQLMCRFLPPPAALSVPGAPPPEAFCLLADTPRVEMR